MPVLLSVTPTVVGSNGTLSWAKRNCFTCALMFVILEMWVCPKIGYQWVLPNPVVEQRFPDEEMSRNWDTPHFQTNPFVG